MKIDIKQLEFIDVNLRAILTDIEKITGVEFTITSLYRIDDDGVHGTLPLRGTDLRMRSRPFGEVVELYVNSKWKYDSQRPTMKCAILHGDGANLHLHIQVSDTTGMV